MKNNQQEIFETAPAPEAPERRYVYNGDSITQSLDGMPRGNRPVRKRKRSPFSIVVVLMTISVLIVFYVWNKLEVNRLAVEVNDLQMQYQKVLYTNETIRAEINKKSGLERIGTIATTQLGMTYPKEQPIWFNLNQELRSQLPEQQ